MSKCECTDHACPAHSGQDCSYPATDRLWRSDMVDLTGTAFCAACAADAFESGLFGGDPEEDEEDEEEEARIADVASMRAEWTETDQESAYGRTSRLSFSVRVF